MKKVVIISFLILLFGSLTCHAITVNSRLALHRAKSASMRMPANSPRHIQAFVKIDSEQALEDLKKQGVTVNCRFGNIFTVTMDADKVDAVSRLKSISAMAVAQMVAPTNDAALEKSDIEGVHDGSGEGFNGHEYTGRGVVLGVIDTGIDYNHINFRDEDGNNRVKRAYLPDDETGTHPVLDGNELPGSHYVTPEEIAALTADNDATSHGTHTTGTAAGSYMANGMNGVAPEADLVLCGMPSNKFSDANIANCVAYIFDYAKSVGKPAVINMSIGSNDWSHDGTSFLSQVFDEVSGPGKICIVSAGNDGNKLIHYRHTISSETDTIRSVLVNPNGYYYNGYVSMWCDDTTPHSLYFTVVDNNTKETVYRSALFKDLDPEEVVEITSDDDPELAQYYTGTIYLAMAEEYNGKFHSIIMPVATPTDRRYYIAVHYGAPVGTNLEAWCSSETYLRNSGFEGYVEGNTLKSISDLATGEKVISVGAYVSKKTVVAERGTMNYNLSPMDDMAAFSSYGPDANGISRPDVCAPGYVLVSSFSRYDTKSRSYGKGYALLETVDEVEYPYGVVYGTSMSTPIVAGAVAVWLQAKSTLTSADIKDILENSSLRDDYVENGDPERWGCGKLRIAEGLRYLLQNSGDPTVLNRIELNEPRLYPNPSDGAFVIDFDNRDKTELKIYSADGRLVYSALLSEPHNALNLQNVLARGMYLVQLRSENTVFVKHLIIR